MADTHTKHAQQTGNKVDPVAFAQMWITHAHIYKLYAEEISNTDQN